eukprot:SAG22_NODE_1755_length_3653_cov_20.353967_3_plen_90_part_00
MSHSDGPSFDTAGLTGTALLDVQTKANHYPASTARPWRSRSPRRAGRLLLSHNLVNEVSAGSPHFFFVSFSIHWIVWSCDGVQVGSGAG